jgi:adenylate kinase
MRLVLMGAPGAGKGTQADLLARRYGIVHISTGEMFREATRAGAPMGLAAKEYMSKGLLVPDSITIGTVRERLSQPDCVHGFILDGFPRNAAQADALDEMLAGLGMPLDAVVDLAVPREKLIERMSGRRLCECGASYHVKYAPPRVEGVCDACGRKLVRRADDEPAVVEERLLTYAEQTQPLIDYYAGKGLLLRVDGSFDALTVDRNIAKVLEMFA